MEKREVKILTTKLGLDIVGTIVNKPELLTSSVDLSSKETVTLKDVYIIATDFENQRLSFLPYKPFTSDGEFIFNLNLDVLHISNPTSMIERNYLERVSALSIPESGLIR